MEQACYERIHCIAEYAPELENPAASRVLALLLGCAEGFAARSRAEPRHRLDPVRSGRLLCAVGIGADEAFGFLRALDNDLVILRSDGNFVVPGTRACSPNLHVVGREGDGVKLHNEVLIHVTAYAELVLDRGWHPSQLVFDPFFANDTLDLWGFATGPSGGSWRDGDIVFAAEAKARVHGGDGLKSLVNAFERLNLNQAAPVAAGHRRKWEELLRLTHDHAIQLLLVADAARWWYAVSRSRAGVALESLG